MNRDATVRSPPAPNGHVDHRLTVGTALARYNMVRRSTAAVPADIALLRRTRSFQAGLRLTPAAQVG